MRYLGIDFGTRKVGLALSDEAGTMGFPHSIVQNDSDLGNKIVALVAMENVGMVVIGDSKDLSGEDNAIAKDARAFGNQIAKRTGIPIAYESEIFTSAEARRQYTPEAKSRAPRETPQVDDSAAALILTSYLSHPNHD